MDFFGILKKENITTHPSNGWLLIIGTLLFSFAYQLPDWPSLFRDLYGYPMVDRTVYEGMIESQDLPVDFLDSYNIINFFTYELVWNFSIAYLTRDLGISTDVIFNVITVVVIWRFAYEVVVRAGWLYMPLLLNPLIVDLAYSQLRIAFAIAALSFFWRGDKNRVLTIIGYILCVAIHTTVIIFGVIHVLVHRLKKPTLIGVVGLILAGVFVAFAIGPMRGIILGAVGDRRADYINMSSTPLYLSYWVFLLTLLVFRWRKSLESIDARYAVVILSIVSSNLLFDGYPTRFLAVAFPSIIIAMSEWKSRPFGLATIVFIPYMIVQWMYWLLII